LPWRTSFANFLDRCSWVSQTRTLAICARAVRSNSF
jgi:hypothetical protein